MSTCESENSSESEMQSVEYENLKNNTLTTYNKVISLKNKVDLLQSKFDLLNISNEHLSIRNKQIKQELYDVNNKEQDLESIFFQILKYYYPHAKISDNCVYLRTDENQNDIITKRDFVNKMYMNFEEINSHHVMSDVNVNSFLTCLPFYDLNRSSKNINIKEDKEIFKNQFKEQMLIDQVNLFKKKYLSNNETNTSNELECFNEYLDINDYDNNNEHSLFKGLTLTNDDNLYWNNLFNQQFNIDEEMLNFKRDRDFTWDNNNNIE